MAFKDSFDEILHRILTAYRNQDPTVDTSKGSLVFMKAVALASSIWALNVDGAYVDAQRFADTCDEETLDHYIAVRGMQVVAGEKLAAKRARVKEDIRHPPAGGNKYDHVRWAKEASPLVQKAWCVSLGQGPGTVDVVILADAEATGSEIATDELCAIVRAYIVGIAPEYKYLRVLPAEVVIQDVTISRVGSTYPAASAIVDIIADMNSSEAGATLYLDQLKFLALGGGPGTAPVTTPPADVPTTGYQIIRPGVINVT